MSTHYLLDVLVVKLCNGPSNQLGGFFSDEVPSPCNPQTLQLARPHPFAPYFLDVVPLPQIVRGEDGQDLPLLAHSSTQKQKKQEMGGIGREADRRRQKGYYYVKGVIRGTVGMCTYIRVDLVSLALIPLLLL